MPRVPSRRALTPLVLTLVTSVAGAQESGDDVQTLIVTGTRSDTRTQFETLTPIDVVTREALARSSASQLVDSLADIVPSFNVQQQPSANGQQFVRPARLRGLSPD